MPFAFSVGQLMLDTPMFGFKLYRVRGNSMVPTLSHGDVLLLRRRGARRGDVVVVEHPRHGIIVKRIGPDGHLSGDGPDSSDALGPFDPATLVGVAVLAVTPAGLRRLSRRRSGTRA
ncbi:MAG: S24/S26 family peptidase [Litorimonas sp.]